MRRTDRRLWVGRRVIVVIAAVLLGHPRCSVATSSTAAVVEHGVGEDQVATIQLTPEAETRLGIATATVERRPLPRRRRYGGEVIVPPRLESAAPPDGGEEQTVFAILPALTPTELIRIAEAQIDADGQVERARVDLDATTVALRRAERLLGDKAGSARTVDEVRAQVAVAEAALRTAKARRALLGAPILVARPPKEVWVRVPIYVGDLSRVRAQDSARVSNLAAAADAPTHDARATVGPPSANPSAATVDLFYALSNGEAQFRLGEKVAVQIALEELQDSLVLPAAAIVHDMNGGAWVYERIAPQTYTRRRVMVAGLVGAEAALVHGPPAGAAVVTDGAAELFGTEFGVGH